MRFQAAPHSRQAKAKVSVRGSEPGGTGFSFGPGIRLLPGWRARVQGQQLRPGAATGEGRPGDGTRLVLRLPVITGGRKLLMSRFSPWFSAMVLISVTALCPARFLR
ncbi:hypothetical protein GCM10009540_04090 [Streptomyces turgidiscabies]